MAAFVLLVAATNILFLLAIGRAVGDKKRLAIIAVAWALAWALVAVIVNPSVQRAPPVNLFGTFTLKVLFNFLVLLAGRGLGNLLDRWRHGKGTSAEEGSKIPYGDLKESADDAPTKTAAPPLLPSEKPVLGFQDRQLGWVFVAAAVVMFLYGMAQGDAVHDWLRYRSGVHGLFLGVAGTVALYAVMRAFEAGRNKG